MTKKFNVFFGTFISSIVFVVIVILAELVKPFKDILKSLFWHHWVGKVVLTVLIFLIIGYLQRNTKSLKGIPAEKLAWYGVLFSLISILLFYVIHYFI